jgi:hypothetical protein
MEINKDEIKELAKALADEMESRHSADLAYKWEGGSIFFIPSDSDTKDHEMPIDKLMHKVVMVRDYLRVLEQQINANEKLSEGDKLKFQNYITKCYGSLTSFNFLFKEPAEKFRSKT